MRYFGRRELLLVAVQLAHGIFGKSSQICAGSHGKVAAIGRLCKLLHGFLIELADDVFALCILPQPVGPLGVGDGCACGGANAYCDDEKLIFPGLLRNIGGGIHRVLAIAQDDQGVGAIGRTAVEVLHGFFQQTSEVGTPAGGPSAVNLLQRASQRLVVVGEGDNQIGIPGKDDEPNAVCGQGCN